MPVSGVTFGGCLSRSLEQHAPDPEIGEEAGWGPHKRALVDLLWEEMIRARIPSSGASFQGKHVRAKQKALEATHPHLHPHHHAHAPGEGRCDEGSTDSAGRPRGCPLQVPLTLHGCLV